MSHYMEEDKRRNLIFLDLEGKDLPTKVTEGNTAKKGYKNKIRLDKAYFAPGDASLLGGAQYSESSGVAHKFRVMGTDFNDDLSEDHSGLIQELSNLATKKSALDKATLNYCRLVNKEMETINTIELDQAKIVSCDRDGPHAFTLEIWAQSGTESTTSFDGEGAAGPATTTKLINLNTLEKD